MAIHRVSKATIEDDLKRILRGGKTIVATMDLGGEVLIVTEKRTQTRPAS